MPEEIPRYPPFEKGLPAAPVDTLLFDHQRELLDKLELAVGSDWQWQTYFVPLFRRYAAYVHLLPASEGHHHRGSGGLLRHGLEMAHAVVEVANQKPLVTEEIPRIRLDRQKAWRIGAVVAALAHDLGKVMTDLTVTDIEGSHWNPGAMSLMDWCREGGRSRYYLHWHGGRGHKHEVLAGQMVGFLVPQGTAIAELIVEHDRDLMPAVLEGAGKAGPIGDLVSDAERRSVNRDLRSMAHQAQNSEHAFPWEVYLRDLMMTMVREGAWTVNEPGSRLWILDGELFIVWPKGGEDLAGRLRRDRIPAIPRDPHLMAEMLIQRGMATGPAKGRYYWHIRPHLGGQVFAAFRALRVGDPETLLAMPPGNVEGEVAASAQEDAGEDRDEHQAQGTEVAHGGAESAGSVSEPDSESEDGPGDAGGEGEGPGPDPAAQATDSKGASPSPDSNSEASVEAGAEGDIPGGEAIAPLTEGGFREVADTLPEEAWAVLELAARWAREGADLAARIEGRQVLVPHPNFAQEAGYRPMDVIKALGAWVEPDPDNPIKKVQNVGDRQYLVLGGEAPSLFLTLRDGTVSTHGPRDEGEDPTPAEDPFRQAGSRQEGEGEERVESASRTDDTDQVRVPSATDRPEDTPATEMTEETGEASEAAKDEPGEEEAERYDRFEDWVVFLWKKADESVRRGKHSGILYVQEAMVRQAMPEADRRMAAWEERGWIQRLERRGKRFIQVMGRNADAV